MDVFVDDEPLADSAFDTVGDAVKAVQTDCPPERLVVQLRCDGQEVSGEIMAEALSRRTSKVFRLDVFTATRHSLVHDAMTQASVSLQETEQECRRVADLLSQGRTQEGMDSFGECLRTWQQINLAVTRSIEILRLDAERLTIRDEPLVDVIGKPKQILMQVRDALAAQDFVMLADVLQYELAEVTEQWYAVLACLREEADRLSEAASD